MNIHQSRRYFLLILLSLLLLVACEPLVPTPTPQVIIVTATASPGPSATPTFTITPTLDVTNTPTPTPAPPTSEVVCADTEGQVIVFDEFDSASATRNMPYRVYVPPCYFAAQRRYPVVYLLHGAANDDTHWEDIGLVETMNVGLRLNRYPPMIIVLPYGGELLAADSFPPDPSLERFMIGELIPRIEQDFCVWEDRDHRSIGGISRGGMWALSIAMRNPDVFGAVGGHSAFLDADEIAPGGNPLDLALTGSFLDTLKFYLDNAAADPVRANVELFSSRLRQRQIAHNYVIHPIGDHNDDYWRAHLDDYLTFYGGSAEDGWPRSTNDLPSCLEPSP